MMHLTDVTGLAGISLAIVALTLSLPVATRLQPKLQAWLAGAILVAANIPFGGMSAAEYVRGITGDLSIATLLLLALPMLGHRSNPLSQKLTATNHAEKFSLFAFVAIAALALYPCALGIGMFDPYRLGFGNFWFISGLLFIALMAWARQHTLVALSLSLAVLGWSIGWYESNNLWDYLLDPWVSIYALAVLLKRGASTAGKRIFRPR